MQPYQMLEVSPDAGLDYLRLQHNWNFVIMCLPLLMLQRQEIDMLSTTKEKKKGRNANEKLGKVRTYKIFPQ